MFYTKHKLILSDLPPQLLLRYCFAGGILVYY